MARIGVGGMVCGLVTTHYSRHILFWAWRKCRNCYVCYQFARSPYDVSIFVKCVVAYAVRIRHLVAFVCLQFTLAQQRISMHPNWFSFVLLYFLSRASTELSTWELKVMICTGPNYRITGALYHQLLSTSSPILSNASQRCPFTLCVHAFMGQPI